jgi:hypothetical protein
MRWNRGGRLAAVAASAALSLAAAGCYEESGAPATADEAAGQPAAADAPASQPVYGSGGGAGYGAAQRTAQSTVDRIEQRQAEVQKAIDDQERTETTPP